MFAIAQMAFRAITVKSPHAPRGHVAMADSAILMVLRLHVHVLMDFMVRHAIYMHAPRVHAKTVADAFTTVATFTARADLVTTVTPVKIIHALQIHVLMKVSVT